MDAGRDAHELEQKRAVRRTLTRFGLQEGERQFDVTVTDPSLGLTGIIDELIFGDDGDIIVVDYKLARKGNRNHRLQLAAYGLLAETHTNRVVKKGYIYLIPVRQWVEVPLTAALRREVTDMLKALQRMVLYEDMPMPTTQRAKCVGCEFRRFCNDV